MPVLVLAVVIIGCKTELLDTAGNPVLDASGNPMMLPESAHKRLKRVTPNTQREIYSAISSAANKGAWAEVANFKLPDNRIKFLIGPTATQEEFDEYLQYVKSNSNVVRDDVELDGEGKYVMLSTCAYVFALSRSVVHGRMFPIDSAGGILLP